MPAFLCGLFSLVCAFPAGPVQHELSAELQLERKREAEHRRRQRLLEAQESAREQLKRFSGANARKAADAVGELSRALGAARAAGLPAEGSRHKFDAMLLEEAEATLQARAVQGGFPCTHLS